MRFYDQNTQQYSLPTKDDLLQALKPIETRYNGYRFRSRTEARWAVFFDHMGWGYEYEKEGYDLNGIWYLPDFWMSKYNIWIEIKPCGNWIYDRKCELLSELGNPVLYVTGNPYHGEYGVAQYANGKLITDIEIPMVFMPCPCCDGGLSVVISSFAYDESVNYLKAFPILDSAYLAARQARFEHGECG